MARATVSERTDDRAFVLLLEQQRAHVLAFLRRLAAGDAEDLLQETYTKVWRLRGGFDPAGNGAAWLLQAAFRTFCDQRSRRLRQPATRDAEGDHPAPVAVCRLEVRDELAHRLAALPPLERELLLGFHVHERSLRELAAQHGLPLNTVKSHLHRARRQLREQPENHE